jgi:hypothetical protein
MADKARMSANGTLGAYLMGHSPVDKALLIRLGMTTEEFVELANAQGDDASLLAALRARDFDEARVRRWSREFTKRYGALIPMWDVDEGYKPATALQRPFVALIKIIEAPAMSLFRRISSAP